MLVYFFFSFANLNFYPFIYYQIYHSSDMKHLNAFLSIFLGLTLLVQPESVFSQSPAETIRWDSSLTSSRHQTESLIPDWLELFPDVSAIFCSLPAVQTFRMPHLGTEARKHGGTHSTTRTLTMPHLPGKK